MKLTKAQRDLLEQTAEDSELLCAPHYKPAQKLVALGLCTESHGKFGSYSLSITDAGRRALEGQV